VTHRLQGLAGAGAACLRILACALLGLAFALHGCAGGGAKKKKTILLHTEYSDQALGDDVAKEIEAEMGLYDSPVLVEYITAIGRRMLPYAPRRPFQYTFAILDQMAPNAFSLPGGHIYVSRGLIALASNEDELAGVIGHEIIHAAERHVAAQQELTRRSSPLVLPWIRMARLAAYSQDHERAADRGGQEIAADAGYDPAALSEFLKHLGDIERLTIGYSRLTSYFGTHPGTTERVATTAADATTIEWERNAARPVADRHEYLGRISGITLGTDPREGVFRGSEFIHPDMDFRLLFPRGWELINTHAAVGAASPDGRAQIILTAGPGRVPLDAPDTLAGTQLEHTREPPKDRALSPKEAADRFIENPDDEFEVGIVKAQPLTLAGIPAYRIDIKGLMSGTSIRGQLTFIAHRGLMFRIAALAPSGSWSNFVGRARTVERTFRPLDDTERNSVELSRLRVVVALEGEDIPSLSNRTRNSWTAGRTAVLNSVFVNQRFREGDRLKIARSTPYRPKLAPEEPATEDDDTATTRD
jgi:predicted Zn-dependent protease